MNVEQPTKPYIKHKLLQHGHGFFICTKKGCNQQIIPMLDLALKTIIIPVPNKPHRNKEIKMQVIRCTNCSQEYNKLDLDKLTKDKKMFRAMKKTA